MTKVIIYDPVTGRGVFEGTEEARAEFERVMNGYDHSQDKSKEKPQEKATPKTESPEALSVPYIKLVKR